ncbi:hypothetical protein [Enterocloster clostridioformis]|uniref:Uncharacterized protein n=1 Tax=Enterocloster clostridioformis TaxID=1531 RepID=A0AAP9S5N0_9FIRM|nr:hypothetical protein [Enterocloster clostridioformis]EHG33249.1 hypothetical protein HMPREF9467_00860 [ [[Clostridium] clostridioforme 2_1_49FAA]QIX89174.1 hypothetical protein FOC47_00390 [Enterocloster clostridioformis]
MGKNNSKRKPRTEFSKMTSIMAKLDNQLKVEKEARKKTKADRKGVK